MSDETLTIGRLAKSVGVNVETIRYYQRRRLIRIPLARWGGIRRYAEQDVRRVRFIKRAQQVGFSLDEVGELLALADGNGCSPACGVAERRLADIDAKIADLVAMRRALHNLVDACQGSAAQDPCPLVASFAR